MKNICSFLTAAVCVLILVGFFGWVIWRATNEYNKEAECTGQVVRDRGDKVVCIK